MTTTHTPTQPEVMTPLDTCQAKVFGAWHSHTCGKKAWAEGKFSGKLVPLCKIHHPIPRAERAAKRPPTQYERSKTAREATQAKWEKLTTDHDKLVDFVRTYPNIYKCESPECLCSGGDYPQCIGAYATQLLEELKL